jgi:hypothetical protein
MSMPSNAIPITIRNCQVLAFCPAGSAQPELESFCDVATLLKLPVHVCEEVDVNTDTLDELISKIGQPKRGESEITLLICGNYLDEQISLAAQYFLVIGFKVVLLRDIIQARNSIHTQFHDMRLVQSGALLTTLQQLGYEWSATEKDSSIREALKMISAAWRPAR